jgi:hypothetical protein
MSSAISDDRDSAEGPEAEEEADLSKNEVMI